MKSKRSTPLERAIKNEIRGITLTRSEWKSLQNVLTTRFAISGVIARPVYIFAQAVSSMEFIEDVRARVMAAALRSLTRKA